MAIKAGLGFADSDFSSIFTYKLGAKYYVASATPVQVDVSGGTIKDLEENPFWLGIQGGYAIFLNDYVSIEPGVR